jgi:hypothetical protein
VGCLRFSFTHEKVTIRANVCEDERIVLSLAFSRKRREAWCITVRIVSYSMHMLGTQNILIQSMTMMLNPPCRILPNRNDAALWASVA